jgi:hypothetical protein
MTTRSSTRVNAHRMDFRVLIFEFCFFTSNLSVFNYPTALDCKRTATLLDSRFVRF